MAQKADEYGAELPAEVVLEFLKAQEAATAQPAVV